VGVRYANHLLAHADAERVADGLRRRERRAGVLPLDGGRVLLYDRGTEAHPPEGYELARRLSDEHATAVLLALVYDDGALVLALSEFGCIADEYDSAPWGEDGVRTTPRGGDAIRLARAFAADEGAVALVLGDCDGYEGPTPRHAALLQALGVPAAAGTVGFAMLGNAARAWDAAAREALRTV
jgi:hypothetical protein